ncbi:GTPase ERA1, chloroplastic-like isoform X2 [Benincasa hispida]|uniref:GTPase ERA1, chloroplastic-like isoform X2 n=1 Tax=Benincasa hispida TaxID=102211 RepID=UPI0019013775|nr:GTPase ERA1, chloroplastic-like isoform X2 [Benincasa hispida]
MFKNQLLSVRIREDEFIEEEEIDGEGTGSLYSDDELSFLSLNEKPNRNLNLLDDYEMEELGYACDRNHRSDISSTGEARALGDEEEQEDLDESVK